MIVYIMSSTYSATCDLYNIHSIECSMNIWPSSAMMFQAGEHDRSMYPYTLSLTEFGRQKNQKHEHRMADKWDGVSGNRLVLYYQ